MPSKRIRAIIMRHFGLPTAGAYPGSAWQQLDPQYQRLADELIAALSDEMVRLRDFEREAKRYRGELEIAKAEIAALIAERDEWNRTRGAPHDA